MIEKITISILHLLRRRIRKAVIMDQHRHNKKVWEKKDYNGKYIDKQSELGAFLYGHANMWERGHFFNGQYLNASMNSCEVIAVYNALLSLSRLNVNATSNSVSFPTLLKTFALNGMVLRGVFGTSIRSLIDYINGLGFETQELIGKKITRERTMQLSDDYNTYIFSSFNSDSNPLSGIHTMCVTREGRNFTVHNDYNGNKSYTSLYEAILSYKSGNANPIIVIGIR